LLYLWTIQNKHCIHAILPQEYSLRETPIHGVCRCIKSISLRNALEDFWPHISGLLLHAQIEQDWGHEVGGLVFWYKQYVLINSVCIQLQNGLLYYCKQFHNPTSVERLGLDCKVEYIDANQVIIPKAHAICIEYTQSEHNDLDTTFHGRILSFSLWYLRWTPLNATIQ